MGTFNRVANGILLCLVAGFSSGQTTPFREAPVSQSGGSGRPTTITSGTWTRLTHAPSGAVSMALLLPDGTVMCQSYNSSGWSRLTPDNTGSYLNGTWSAMPSLPSGYMPLYYASAVLPDGRVFVEGGEYNGTSGGEVWTNLGAIYSPVTNTWTSLTPPPGWSQIGDSQCVLFPDGVSLMVANILNGQTAILNTSTLAWTLISGSGKRDRNDEEGWVLLADGTIMTVDAENAGGSPNAERYIPSTQTWIGAGTTPARYEDSGSEELGPMVLRPNGTIFVMGATGANGVYTPPTTLTGSGSWAAAPSFPNIGGVLDIADGPACLLPDGNVLMDASPGIFNTPSHFFEFDGTNLTQVNAVPRATSDSSYVGGMLMLPTGQVLFTDHSNDVEIYTPTGSPQDAWRPTISSVATTLQLSSTNNLLQGTQLNGLSQCTAYGDDATNATNYPLVRIVNGATGHVFYCRTHNHSTMAVATGSATVSTQFDVPAGVETGPSNLYVVANGIQSAPQVINVVAAHVYLPNSVSFVVGSQTGGSLSSLYFTDTSSLTGTIAAVSLLSEPPLQVQFSATSPTTSPTSFQFTTTGHVNSINLSESVLLYNFSTNAYETVNTATASNGTDGTVTVTGSGTLSRYVNPATNEVRARITYLRSGPTTVAGWGASLNTVNWIIQ